MATSAVMQSLVAKSAPSMYSPRHQRPRSIMLVRCQSEDLKAEEAAPAAASEPLKAPSSPIQTPLPTSNKKGSTKFSDVFAFSGPAPERINGRLAMIGFVSAIAVELARGDDVSAQLANGGLPWFVGTTVVLSVASLVPLLKGVSVQSKSDGVMTSDAEMWNGRFAMLGLVALFFTEYLKGGALI
eukprot:TRINITY_DN445_c0_g1_i2.p1 TRINITY_DN445_c0_g1~~TRINITY_DN445_c0_g1_i2.p1  ORF type:complete len:185 (-),score=21.63 TRINITY_DN445_c0_g1_i2:190-744(-)